MKEKLQRVFVGMCEQKSQNYNYMKEKESKLIKEDQLLT